MLSGERKREKTQEVEAEPFAEKKDINPTSLPLIHRL